jgi:phage recombination protein Bet
VTTALATVQPDAMQPFFTNEQEKMILAQFLGGASKSEAAVLLEIVKRRRLDPFSRQVYFVKRWDAAKHAEVWAIQTSIDGLRSIAERTGKYDGQDEPEYGEDEAGKFCKVKVYRKDWSPNRAAVGIAYLNEFIQKKKDGTATSFWARMPRLMLAKCAEALAIRKAFPEDAAGLYISEEMPEERPQMVAPVHHEPLPPGKVEVVKAEPEALSPGIDPPSMDSPPPEDDPEEFGEASAMRARIQACKSMGQLLVLGNELKKASDEVRQAVRAAYAQRRDEIKAEAGGES